MRLRSGIMISSFMAVAIATVAAFTFQPMFVRLDPAGSGSIQTFEVRNEGDKPLAVMFSVLTRAVTHDGVELNQDASNLFTIYPPRMVVEPRSSAMVKLQWNGPTRLEAERAFRLVAENIALDSGGAVTSGIQLRYRYIAAVYIGEASFEPDLVCSVKGITGPEGDRGLLVEIVNKGTRHVVADSARLVVAGIAGRELALEADRLGHLSGENYLPDSPRSLFIPLADAVPGKNYDARLLFEAIF